MPVSLFLHQVSGNGLGSCDRPLIQGKIGPGLFRQAVLSHTVTVAPQPEISQRGGEMPGLLAAKAHLF